MSVFETVHFIVLYIFLPIILSVLYSIRVKNNKLNYDLTKGAFYLCYAAFTTIYYLINQTQQAATGLAITIAIFEGLPLILIPLFNKDCK